MNFKHSVIISLLLTINFVAAVWNPDAGLIYKYPVSTITTSSTAVPGEESLIIDGIINTCWQSSNAYPDEWKTRSYLNILLGYCTANPTLCVGASNTGDITNGEYYDGVVVSSQLTVSFSSPKSCHRVGVKLSASTASVIVDLGTGSSTWTQLTIVASGNYQFASSVCSGSAITSVRVRSSAPFTIEEIVYQAEGTYEQVILDLGSNKEVGYITGNFYTENSVNSEVSISTSLNGPWTLMGVLNTSFWGWDVANKQFDTPARYVKVKTNMLDVDWAKAQICDVKVYSQYGPYGPPLPATPNPRTFYEIHGVNGIFGMDTGTYSNNNNLESPIRFKPVASHIRNYHEMCWDVMWPSDIPDYTAMAQGQGTPPQDWLNWDTEYQEWREAGMKIEMAIQFSNDSNWAQCAYDPAKWPNPYQNAYNYGYAFARHFGPTYGNNLADWVAVGNEPWKYPASFMSTVHRGMSAGLKAGDPSIKVITSALQADEPEEVNAPEGNYIGTRILEQDIVNFDGISIHPYSWYLSPKGKPGATWPEDRRSYMNSVRNLIRWRNANAPGKTIELTEFGFDSPGPLSTDECLESYWHDPCVSQEAQGVYGLRALLKFAREGVDRATWYNAFDNEPDGELFDKSGLVGARPDWSEKMSFGVFRSWMKHYGTFRFLNVIKEDSNAHVYLIGNITHRSIVAWKPVHYDDATSSPVTFTIPSTLSTVPASTSGFRFSYTSTYDPSTILNAVTTSSNQWTVSITRDPIVLTATLLPSTTSTTGPSSTTSTTSTTGPSTTTSTTSTTGPSTTTTTTTTTGGSTVGVQTSKTFAKTEWHNMYYLEYLPVGYGNGQKFPILIFLHGWDERRSPSISNLAVLTSSPLATIPYLIHNNQWNSILPFIVISPQTEYWWDVDEIDAAVRIAKTYTQHGNQSRIYVTGVHMGANIWEYVNTDLTKANSIAAIVPIATASPPSTSVFTPIIQSNLPVWAFHDQNDPNVDKSVTQAWINGISTTVPTPILTLTNTNTHTIWTTIYNPNPATNPNYIYTWLLSK
ncbi:hypothetical protein DLAC_00154 [Tieghemostelium lacteum]|uniref:F5/8 type C domain-containing protein n=1 Tax=Tieghemostelium lacteum TaxID=361077 RepID=A0A152A988_TIELA|nr:hypothetical protein DLAC_00154 [Tieghemostelium lacteum]|eukprot:KYR02695.1 hypothetical protein DLAC_00154 [Tieghemostelium lacteum]